MTLVAAGSLMMANDRSADPVDQAGMRGQQGWTLGDAAFVLLGTEGTESRESSSTDLSTDVLLFEGE